MAKQVENDMSYEIDYNKVNVLIIYFIKLDFQMTTITTNVDCFLGCHTCRQN